MSHIKHFLVGQFFMCYKSPSSLHLFGRMLHYFFAVKLQKHFVESKTFQLYEGEMIVVEFPFSGELLL